MITEFLKCVEILLCKENYEHNGFRLASGLEADSGLIERNISSHMRASPICISGAT